MQRCLPRAGLVFALAVALCAAARLARAQPAVVEPPAATALDVAVPDPAGRPRLSLAAGMGATFDATGFADGGTHAIPAFFGVGGFGDGLFGVDLGSFASSASGRFHGELNGETDSPVDRLALDAFGVIRPAARVRPGDDRYRLRVLRTVAAELGLGVERDGRLTGSGSRFALHTGARVELPLTRPRQPSELRLRLAVRRAIGLYTPKLSGATSSDITSVGDTNEIYAALAVVF
jgi:hypothetical protein